MPKSKIQNWMDEHQLVIRTRKDKIHRLCVASTLKSEQCTGSLYGIADCITFKPRGSNVYYTFNMALKCRPYGLHSSGVKDVCVINESRTDWLNVRALCVWFTRLDSLFKLLRGSFIEARGIRTTVPMFSDEDISEYVEEKNFENTLYRFLKSFPTPEVPSELIEERQLFDKLSDLKSEASNYRNKIVELLSALRSVKAEIKEVKDRLAELDTYEEWYYAEGK